jgi:hypothetical protein
MRELWKTLVRIVTLRHVCQACSGEGFVQVGYNNRVEEKLKCSVCLGSGVV